MNLRPVFIYDNGAALYQTGARQLAAAPVVDLVVALERHGIGLAVALSAHVDPDIGLYVRHLHAEFGDNAQFRDRLPVVRPVVSRAADTLRRGQSVLVYCHYGVNRSGLVNALIVRELRGCPGAEALAVLRTRRRGACGGNHHFERYLEGLECP